MPQGRKVRLVVHRIEPLSVLKYSAVLYLCLYVVLVIAGVVMWMAASATGLRDNVEGFIGSLLASDDFRFLGRDILRASVTGGAILVALGTGANLVMVTLYNLISELVGGVQVTFEEPVPVDDTDGQVDGKANGKVDGNVNGKVDGKVDLGNEVAVPRETPVD